MIEGRFIEELPSIPITVAWREAHHIMLAVLDTGFSGDLQLTPEIVNKLGLRVSDLTSVILADGSKLQIPTGLAIAVMEESGKSVQVLISDSTPLVGIGFLSKFGYKAIVDCKHRKVRLQKA